MLLRYKGDCMISIIIYGKQKLQINLLRQSLDKYIMMEDLDVRINGTFFTADDLLKELVKINKPIICLLYLEPKTRIEVIQLAELIRKEDPMSFIIFIGNDRGLAIKLINLQFDMMDFILKNNRMFDGLIYALNIAITKYQLYKQFKNLTVKNGKKKITMPMNSIIAITKSEKSRKLILHKADGTIECSGQIKEIRILLDENFHQIDRSCIINAKHIIGYDLENDAVIMTNNQRYLVSKKCRNKIRNLVGK